MSSAGKVPCIFCELLVMPENQWTHLDKKCSQRRGRKVYSCKYNAFHVFREKYDMITHETTECKDRELNPTVVEFMMKKREKLMAKRTIYFHFRQKPFFQMEISEINQTLLDNLKE